jgi:hypothetical protein
MWTAGKNRSVRLVFLMPVVFGSLHLAYGAGSLWGCVRLAGLLAKARIQVSKKRFQPGKTPEAAR